jgi:hypothetical protein
MTNAKPGWLVSPLIENFRKEQDLEEIERLADDLGESGDKAAIDVLVSRLGDGRVQTDDDTRDAICSALVRLGVMSQLGNLTYRFRSDEEMPAEGRVAIATHIQTIPQGYFVK